MIDVWVKGERAPRLLETGNPPTGGWSKHLGMKRMILPIALNEVKGYEP